jgi:DNA-binding winged helix-turn-helix (wHTH) protein/Tfp pilus assembly protein PilF
MGPSDTIQETTHRGYRFGSFLLDLDRATLFKDGIVVKLRPQSFDVLAYLLERHGCLVDKHELIQAIWGDAAVTEDSLTHCIIDIRKAIGDCERTLIQTIPRRGFIFDAPAEFVAPLSSLRTIEAPITRILPGVALALVIVATIWFSVGQYESRSDVEAISESGDAQNHYAHARFLFSRRLPDDLELSRDYFLRAIELQPDFAEAWAGLAGSYTIEWFTTESSDPELPAKLKAAAEMAVELDPTLAEGWIRLSGYYRAMGDDAEADRYLERALKENPDSPLLLSKLAGIYALEGDLDRAIEFQRLAVDHEPLSFINRGNLSQYLFIAGFFDEALEESQRAHQIRPASSTQPEILRGLVSILTGRYSDALDEIESWPDGPEKYSVKAMALLKLGDKGGAESLMKRLERLTSAESYVRRAELLAFCEEFDRSFAVLWELRISLLPDVDQRLRQLDLMDDVLTSRFLTPLRSDSRWEAWLSDEQTVAYQATDPSPSIAKVIPKN